MQGIALTSSKPTKATKAVIRGLHPKTNTDKISEELAKIEKQVRSINNIYKYDTKQPLPLFLIEIEPRINNKDIYDIEKLLNTIVKVGPPRHKKRYPTMHKVPAIRPHKKLLQ